MPRGWPPPSQCSSSPRIASAVPGVNPAMRTISAPRSQRARISAPVDLALDPDRVEPLDPRADARPGATVRTDQRKAGKLPDQSMRFEVRLATWSSAPNSAAILAEFAEQPASLSRSA